MLKKNIGNHARRTQSVSCVNGSTCMNGGERSRLQKQAVELVAVYLREQESGLEIRSLIKTPIGCWPGIGSAA